MTPEWKDQVRAVLRERGLSEQWLADEVARRRGIKAMKRDTINKLLRRQMVSALVPDICDILGVPPPMTATPVAPDEETQRLIRLALKAPPDVRRAVLVLLEGAERSKI
jgi:hypothetical protein